MALKSLIIFNCLDINALFKIMVSAHDKYRSNLEEVICMVDWQRLQNHYHRTFWK
jgi:hypothetical protein